eukprot:jgi/Tetstr1/424544/TSEL_015071.t1
MRGAVLDRDRSGAGDLTLETSGLRPTDRSRPSDLTLAGWGGAACDYMIDFACVSSTTPTWSNDPRWCIPGIAATEAEHAKLAADRGVFRPSAGCSPRRRLLVLYGSETGNAQDVAERVGREAGRRHWEARAMPMDAFDVTGLPGEQLVVFVAATTGQASTPPPTLRVLTLTW